MKRLKKILVYFLLFCPLIFAACGTIDVSGKTFIYSSVSIDWGTATDEDKQSFFESNQVNTESEMLAVLKTKDNRDQRFTTFGTNGEYFTKNSTNEILDQGFYRQDDTIITLADTEDELNDASAFTLQANEKGYIVTVKLDDENKIFAKYQYIEQE